MAVFSGVECRLRVALLQRSYCVAISSCRSATLLPVFAADCCRGTAANGSCHAVSVVTFSFHGFFFVKKSKSYQKTERYAARCARPSLRLSGMWNLLVLSSPTCCKRHVLDANQICFPNMSTNLSVILLAGDLSHEAQCMAVYQPCMPVRITYVTHECRCVILWYYTISSI